MKHIQESELKFRKNGDDVDYPFIRGLVIYQYGGEAEECIVSARKELNLGTEWEVINFTKAGI